MKLGDKEFICEKCNKNKSTDGALMNRDPDIDYCICRECRDILVSLISKAERETTISFLQPERSKREDNKFLEAEFGNKHIISTVLKSTY